MRDYRSIEVEGLIEVVDSDVSFDSLEKYLLFSSAKFEIMRLRIAKLNSAVLFDKERLEIALTSKSIWHNLMAKNMLFYCCSHI